MSDDDRELYKTLSRVRKAKALVKALDGVDVTPESILSSSDEWRRGVENYAQANKGSDITWSIVAILVEP